MKRIVLLFVVLILAGCATANFTPYAVKPRYFGEVTIYNEAPEGSEKVGVITLDSADMSSAISKAKQVAATHGASGIVLAPEDVYRHGMYSRYGVTCLAIRMQQEELQ